MAGRMDIALRAPATPACSWKTLPPGALPAWQRQRFAAIRVYYARGTAARRRLPFLYYAVLHGIHGPPLFSACGAGFYTSRPGSMVFLLGMPVPSLAAADMTSACYLPTGTAKTLSGAACMDKSSRNVDVKRAAWTAPGRPSVRHGRLPTGECCLPVLAARPVTLWTTLTTAAFNTCVRTRTATMLLSTRQYCFNANAAGAALRQALYPASGRGLTCVRGIAGFSVRLHACLCGRCASNLATSPLCHLVAALHACCNDSNFFVPRTWRRGLF